MIGEAMLTASESGTMRPSYINYCLKSEYPLHFFVSYAQPRTVRKEPLQSPHTKRKKEWCPASQLYQLSSEK